MNGCLDIRGVLRTTLGVVLGSSWLWFLPDARIGALCYLVGAMTLAGSQILVMWRDRTPESDPD